MLPADTQVLKDAEAVARRACERVVELAQRAIRERGVFRLVMAGGGTPKRAYELLAQTAQDWDQWELYWGDERCLPVDDPERNSHLGLPTPNRYPIPAELGAEAAAAAYAQTIAGKLPFDLVMLGMGEDGHTASLFPNTPLDLGASVIPVHEAPKPPPDRVSLNVSVLRDCRAQLLLVTGSGKIEALKKWKAGEPVPIARVAKPDACLLLDGQAAAALQ